MAEKKKILFLQKDVSEYNVPLYNYLCNYFLVTIGYTGNAKDSDLNRFNVQKLNTYSFRSLFFVKGLRSFCGNFDVVIYMADLHFISFCFLPFTKNNFKVISWSIGFRASYKRKYDIYRKKDIVDYLYLLLLRQSNANVFYSKGATKFWGNLLCEKKVFIANNTIKVDVDKEFVIHNSRTRLVFIGTLYKQKGIDELLRVVKRLIDSNLLKDRVILDIIGDGPEYCMIRDYIKINKLESTIQLYGSIYDSAVLTKLFSNCILCISPSQAGLSVLLSLGYGVPFVTKYDAITGGEMNNIVNGVTGYLYNSEDELYNIILNSYNDTRSLEQMGLQSYEYYKSHCTIEKMGDGFIEAIDFVLK